jgi:hypothetical protein
MAIDGEQQQSRKAAPMQRVEIRIEGCLEPEWTEWFAGLTLSHSARDTTLISGEVVDQAALYGLIGKLRDLGVRLVSITFEETPPMCE